MVVETFRIRRAVFRLLLAVAAFGAGYSLRQAQVAAHGTFRRESFELSHFTTPYLEPGGARSRAPELLRAREDIQDVIAMHQRRDSTLEVSTFVQRLGDGSWMGIDEHRPFRPASLWKVAVLYHVLARAEDDPSVLEERIRFPGPDSMPSVGTTSDLPPDHQLQPGHSYTRDDLLRRMIGYSDNHAADLLLQGVEEQQVTALMLALGVEIFRGPGGIEIDASEYTLLFSVLYHSSFFSRPLSERALGYLADGSYMEGLRKHLPDDVQVASKFGYALNGDELQLHECGIVYLPGDPYALCVMTRARGTSLEALGSIIAGISGRIHAGLAAAGGRNGRSLLGFVPPSWQVDPRAASPGSDGLRAGES